MFIMSDVINNEKLSAPASSENSSDSDSSEYIVPRRVTSIVKDLKPAVSTYLFNLLRCSYVKITKVHRSFKYDPFVNINQAYACMGIFYDFLIRREVYCLKDEDPFDNRATYIEELYELFVEMKLFYESRERKVCSKNQTAEEVTQEDGGQLKTNRTLNNEASEITELSNNDQKRDLVDGAHKPDENGEETDVQFNNKISSRNNDKQNGINEEVSQKDTEDEAKKLDIEADVIKYEISDTEEQTTEKYTGSRLKDLVFYYFRQIPEKINAEVDDELKKNELIQRHKETVSAICRKQNVITYIAKHLESVNTFLLSYQKYKDRKIPTLNIIEDIYNTSMLHMVWFSHPFTSFNSELVNEFNLKSILRYVKTINLNDILINPGVGTKYFYADADLILSDTVFEIKTSKYSSLNRYNREISKTEFYQLIFYALGLFIRTKREIKKFKIYNPLLGFEYVLEVPHLNFAEFLDFVEKEVPL